MTYASQAKNALLQTFKLFFSSSFFSTSSRSYQSVFYLSVHNTKTLPSQSKMLAHENSECFGLNRDNRGPGQACKALLHTATKGRRHFFYNPQRTKGIYLWSFILLKSHKHCSATHNPLTNRAHTHCCILHRGGGECSCGILSFCLGLIQSQH
ncbi:hypothetical protein FKM82_022884 [Ascaphus truei]